MTYARMCARCVLHTTAMNAILPAGHLTDEQRSKVDYKFNVKNLCSVPVPYGDHRVSGGWRAQATAGRSWSQPRAL